MICQEYYYQGHLHQLFLHVAVPQFHLGLKLILWK